MYTVYIVLQTDIIWRLLIRLKGYGIICYWVWIISKHVIFELSRDEGRSTFVEGV